MTCLPHQACVVLKRKPVARGTRAPRVSSIVDGFSRLPSLVSVVGSIAPPACPLALATARVLGAGIGEDAQSDNTLATTPDGPEAVWPVGTWPSFDGPEPLPRDGPSDSPVQ